ncbi:rhodanese-like domain-containing protein [Actinomadura coerulea]|uniref:rhodanese-like domain-containing protein n=1 Tax=Actinomadura coerulea TaxID=46159 RepID=UPI0034434EC7
MNAADRVPAATAEEALRHFAARLAFETDVADVAARLAEETPGIVVVDTRSAESWSQGHVRGAVHLVGGFEYWAREGHPVEAGGGAVTRRSPDPLTAPVNGVSCAC